MATKKTLKNNKTVDEGNLLPISISSKIIESTKADSICKTTKREPENKYGAEIITPPYNYSLLLLMPSINTRLSSSIDILTTNMVGLGVNILPNEEAQRIIKVQDKKLKPEELEKKQEVEALIKEETEKLRKILKNPQNPYRNKNKGKLKPMTFSGLIKNALKDRETIGNGFIEVSRDLKNEIDGIYHIPGHTVRVLKDGGFVQIRNEKKVYFKEFGDERIIGTDDGKEHDNGYPIEKRANEIIPLMIYSSRSSYYGIPRYEPAIPCITGNRLVAIRNVSFFDNDCVPRFAILVENGKLRADAEKNILKMLDNVKGAKNHGRVLIIESEQQSQQSLMQSGNQTCHLKLQPISVGVKEDATYMEYKKANDEEVRETFRIDKAYYDIENTNKASSVQGRQITIETVFIPETIEIEYILNNTLVEAMDLQWVEIRFERPSSIDQEELSKVFENLGKLGGITPNDVRRLLTELGYTNYEPFDADWAAMPITMALQSLTNEKEQQPQEQENPDEKENVKDTIQKVFGPGNVVKSLLVLNQLLDNQAIKDYNQGI